MLSWISFWTVARGRCRTAAIAARLQRGVGRRDVRVDPGAGRRDRVDGDVADRQARVVRPLELQDRRARPPDVLRQVGVRRAEVREGRRAGVVGGRSRRRTRVEVLRRRERLRGELRADDVAVARDQAAVRLVLEGDLRRSRSSRAGRRSRRRASATTIAIRDLTSRAHQCINPSTIGPSVSAGKIIRPAVSDDHADEQDDERRRRRCGTCRPRRGTVFFCGQRAAERERGDQRHEPAEQSATAPSSAEKSVAP